MNHQNRQVLLNIKNLKMYFPIKEGFRRRVKGFLYAVDDVSLSINQGETLGLVGESGCGKTTTARCILRVLKPTAGQIFFKVGSETTVDLAALSRREVRPLRRHMQMVFQDPFSSLNPRMTLFDIVGEPLLVQGMRNRKERHERVAELLSQVGLRPEYMSRYPHAFSGGQRQRISMARALALNPRLVVADEPTSSLDVSVQAQILNLMLELQDEFHLTYMFVAHDLSVVRHVCDRVAVMYVGKIVEVAPSSELFAAPRHPYTEALLSAIPKPDPRLRSERILLEGDVANPADPPSGCYFHPRCRYAQDVCRVETPVLTAIESGHLVSCHRAEEISLRGING